MTETNKIALIGAGRMGGALLSGWLAGRVAASDVIIVDPMPGRAARAAIEAGAAHYESLTQENAKQVGVVLLGIKPQMFHPLGPKIAAALGPDCCVVSILAGTTQAKLGEVFGTRPIVRAMPNTPAAIGQGITAFYRNFQVDDALAAKARQLLEAGGDVIEVDDEGLIDAVTAVSGSGPAYVFHMAEALEAAGIRAGLPKVLAEQLARKTISGSGALLDASDDSATRLREAVTSPGGTTQAALEVLMSEEGLAKLIRQTVAAAVARSKELGAS